MARSEIRFRSETLRKSTTMTVVFPDSTPGPWNVVYLLHGLSCDHSSWAIEYPVEEWLRERPLMYVCPDGDRGYYANESAPGGNRYEDFVAGELPAFLDRVFPVRADAAGRMVAGLSMGGYGAMMLGLKHPDVFGALYSTSGSMYFAECDHPQDAAYPTALMNSLDPEAYSCFRLATALAAHGGEALRIKFDCGLQDYLLEVNRKLHARLDELGLPHDYAEYPGVHDGSYWQPRFADLLAYIDDVFGIEAKSK